MATPKSSPPWYAIAVALIIIALFGWLSYHMIVELSPIPPKQQYRWDRAFAIYTALQAFAAAAVGVVLGATTQQGNVNAANARAAVADNRANQLADKATKADLAKKMLDALPPPGEGNAAGAELQLAQLRAILSDGATSAS